MTESGCVQSSVKSGRDLTLPRSQCDLVLGGGFPGEL